MRAAAILGLGCSVKDLEPFQRDESVEWLVGMPATRQDADVILLFGGDGTVHRHLRQFIKLGLPILVVPAGSGNDFSSSLGLRRVRDSLAAWRKFRDNGGNIREIDLGVISPINDPNQHQSGASPPEIPASAEDGQKWDTPIRYFCCVAGVGFDAEVARRANRLPRWLRGNGGYVLGVVPTIFTFDPFPLRIFVPGDGEPSNQSWTLRNDQPALLAAFANAPLYGGGMKIAPQAKMDDGVLDVCVVGSVHRAKLFSLFPTVYAGKHLKIREVDYFQGARFRVETEQPLDVYADGEFVCRTPVEFSVRPDALKVVIP